MVKTRLNPRSPTPPVDPHAIVQAVHGGEILILGATAPSLGMVRHAHGLLVGLLGQAPEQRVHPFARVAEARRVLEADPTLARLAAETLVSLGFPDESRLDLPRLRVVPHGAEKDPAAAAVFLPHRDTWYGCPQAQINAWLPLHDLPLAQSFAFYPTCFDAAVPNSSAGFEYGAWMQQVGWHGDAPVGAYAQELSGAPNAPEVRFSAQSGDVLLFAGHHLHQTRPNPLPGTTRFSLDFRWVAPWGGAPPRVDDHSRGADIRLASEFRPISLVRQEFGGPG